jgi:hypothetical protein
MAAVINDKTQQELQAQQAQQQTQQVQQTAQTNAAAAANPAATGNNTPSYQTPLKGVSETTANKLGQYSQGYQASGSVQAAQNYLNNVLNNKPVADANLSALYDKIMNREQFNYDLNGDALYQQYKDQYQNLGRQAMMDTMGNATQLTGGYGSSYASTAGNQAYQQYLGQLNDIVPELYQMAYDRYNQEGNDMLNRYNLAYGQHRDNMGDWQNERSYADADYWNKYNADYSDYQNMLNYWNNMAQMENSAYYTERDYAHSLAMAMINRKQMPSADILAMAGMTEADAIKLGAKKPSSGGGSSKKKTSYTPTTNTDDDEEETKPTTSYMTSSRLMQMMDSAANSKYNKTSTSTENKNWLSNLFKK